MKKNNNLTELVFILDRSGSMSGLESDTIGANIDAIETIETAARFGIERNRAVNYNADSKGTQILYETLSFDVLSIKIKKMQKIRMQQNLENVAFFSCYIYRTVFLELNP